MNKVMRRLGKSSPVEDHDTRRPGRRGVPLPSLRAAESRSGDGVGREGRDRADIGAACTFMSAMEPDLEVELPRGRR